MAKKKATTKKPAPKASRPTKKSNVRQAAPKNERTSNRSQRQPRAAGIHVYRHEIDGNPNNAPLIVDIPIAEGRGKNPPRPSMVSFTAEMSDEQWPDQFAFRVISLEGDSVRVMVSRIDKGTQEQGWGVKLVIHLLVVDRLGA
jgi:hypothetical protein